MLTPASGLRVYIATGSTDMRKAINRLTILVESRMKLDAFSMAGECGRSGEGKLPAAEVAA